MNYANLPDLYRSPPSECPYLPAQSASNIIVDPFHPVSMELYDRLIEHGFRRNAQVLYRPHCPGCSACVSVRVNTEEFAPGKSQRRIQGRNHDLHITHGPTEFRDEHFAMYLAYQHHRHCGDTMDDPDPEKYRQFLLESTVRTELVEMRRQGDLVAVSVIDILTTGISAVYTFFDPALEKRSPGTFAILYLIELARKLQLPWVYLGYWIEECRKMQYKSIFRPMQGFDVSSGQWRELSVFMRNG